MERAGLFSNKGTFPGFICALEIEIRRKIVGSVFWTWFSIEGIFSDPICAGDTETSSQFVAFILWTYYIQHMYLPLQIERG